MLLSKQGICSHKCSKQTSGVAAGCLFLCLLGPYPKPCEQPRCRGWLRVRFTNAVVPATQEQAGLSPLGEPEKRQTRPCWKKKNGAGLYLLPLPDCGKARKRLSG